MTAFSGDVMPTDRPLRPARTAGVVLAPPPVEPVRLPTLQDLLAGYPLVKRGATRAAYATDVRS